MDKASTIHIVSEIAVLSVMFVYFDRKLKTIESNMEFMKKNYMNAFEDIYKKLELLKQGVLTTQTMYQMNNNSSSFSAAPTFPKQTKIGKLEKIESNDKKQDEIVNTEIIEKELDTPNIQKKAFTTLISELSILSPPEKNKIETAKVEIVDESEEITETNENKQENEITENDMNEIEKLIEGKKD